LSKSSCYSGVSETMFTSLMRRASVGLRRSYAYWQLEKLLCCPMMRAEPRSLSSHIQPDGHRDRDPQAANRALTCNFQQVRP
jgi:hypothetical protein